MANAKEYQDLTEATSIDTDALVALAQPNAPELQTSKMSALAAKIQELNADGPLAELELATAIGKQQLAEALTEKGVPTTANETEIQMADKVRGLQTVSGFDQIRGLVTNQLESANGYSTYSMSDSYARFFRNIANGDVIVLSGGVMSYIPYGEYNSVQEFFAAATHTVDVTEGGTGYTFSRNYGMYAVSEDFSKILVTLNDSGLRRIYSVSKDAGFSLVKEFTKDASASDTKTGWAVRNDGRYIVYGTGDKQLSVYDTDTDTDYLLNFPTSLSTYSYLAKVLMKDSNLYFVGRTTPSSSYTSLIGKVSYTIAEDGSVTFGSPEVNQEGPSMYSLTDAEWIHKPGEDTVAPLLWHFGDSYTLVNKIATNAPLGQLTLYSLSLANTLVSTSNVFKVKIMPLDRTSINSNYYTGSFLGLAAGTLTFTDDEYVFKSVALPYALHINKHTGVVSTPAEEHVYVTIMPEYSSSGAYNTPMYSNPATGFYIFCSGSNTDNYKIGTIYYTSYNLDKDKYIFGYQKQKNDATAYYLPMINHAVLNTGAYDAATTTVPLPEESQSQQEAN